MATLRRIADAIGCSVSELYQDQRDTSPLPETTLAGVPLSVEKLENEKLSSQLIALAQQMGARRTDALEVYQANRHYPGLQLMQGDLIVAERGRAQEPDGQFQIVQVQNDDLEHPSITLMVVGKDGHFSPVYGEMDPPKDSLVTIIAKAIFTVRPPQPST